MAVTRDVKQWARVWLSVDTGCSSLPHKPQASSVVTSDGSESVSNLYRAPLNNSNRCGFGQTFNDVTENYSGCPDN